MAEQRYVSNCDRQADRRQSSLFSMGMKPDLPSRGASEDLVLFFKKSGKYWLGGNLASEHWPNFKHFNDWAGTAPRDFLTGPPAVFPIHLAQTRCHCESATGLYGGGRLPLVGPPH